MVVFAIYASAPAQFFNGNLTSKNNTSNDTSKNNLNLSSCLSVTRTDKNLKYSFIFTTVS